MYVISDELYKKVKKTFTTDDFIHLCNTIVREARHIDIKDFDELIEEAIDWYKAIDEKAKSKEIPT